MGAPNASDILVAKPDSAGALLTAVLGTTLPASATASVTAFTGLGYLGDGGIVEHDGNTSTDIKAFGAGVVRVVRTENILTYKTTLLQSDLDSLTAIYGSANVSGTTGDLTIIHNGASTDPACFVLNLVYGDTLIRICIGNGQITEVGDRTFKDSEAASREITITCYPDASGNKAYEYQETITGS